MRRARDSGGILLAAAAVAFAGWTATLPPPQGERYELAGERVAIYNLAGIVRVEAGSGSAVVVEVRRGGRDGGELRVETGRIDGSETLRVVYPTEEVVYPEGHGRWQTQLRVREDGTFGDRGRRVRIRSRGDGLEAFADLTIRVPPGKRLALYHAVGEVAASDVQGDLSLDTHSATVTASGVRGELLVDVGSGSVTVSDVEGDVNVDTGSGGVTVTAVRGDELIIDTGSGSVRVTNAAVRSLDIDTGSGEVEAAAVTAQGVRIDTGSGDVGLALAATPDAVSIDTGSGSVTVMAPDDFGARVEIETSSGDIDLGFPVDVRRWEPDEVVGTIGDGRGRLVIDTGSGDVRLRRGG